MHIRSYSTLARTVTSARVRLRHHPIRYPTANATVSVSLPSWSTLPLLLLTVTAAITLHRTSTFQTHTSYLLTAQAADVNKQAASSSSDQPSLTKLSDIEGSGAIMSDQSSKQADEGGEYKNGLLDGEGFRHYPDGSIYRGSFSLGKRHGRGQLTRDDGSAYEGEFVDDAPDGMGIEWAADGEIVLAGRWHHGEFAECAVVPRAVLISNERLPKESHDAEFLLHDGSPARYDGQRNANGQPHGKGTMYDKEGKPVQGDLWKDGKQEGKGYLRLRNAYVGNFHEGRFHGYGEYTVQSGTKYMGDWVFDHMEGLGVLTLADGIVLEGRFHDSVLHGFGVRYLPDGTQEGCGWWQEGQLIEAKPVPTKELPKGINLSKEAKRSDLIFPAIDGMGRFYRGEVNSEHEAYGKGKLYDFDGKQIAGENWVHNKQEGEGFMIMPSGEKYVGPFVAGEASGEGVLYYADNREQYRGQFLNNLFHGHGTYRQRLPGDNMPASSDIVYTGEFANGFKEGLGVEKRGELTYEGQWSQDFNHGYGVITGEGQGVVRTGRWEFGRFKHEVPVPSKFLPQGVGLSAEAKTFEFINMDGNGITYVGARNEANQPHGEGHMVDKEGKRMMGGEWKDGLMDGQGFMNLADGSKYVGHFAEGMFEGHGTMAWANGDIFVGQWKEDKRNGEGELTYANGIRYQGQWEHDETHGLGKVTLADGSHYEGEWLENKKAGFGAVWNAAGRLQNCGIFVDDLLRISRPIPTKIIRIGTALTKEERNSTLLYPNGDHYTGSVNSDRYPHGDGILSTHEGKVRSSGKWDDGVAARDNSGPDTSEVRSEALKERDARQMAAQQAAQEAAQEAARQQAEAQEDQHLHDEL